MARQFTANGLARIQIGSAPVSAYPLTISAWIYPLATGAAQILVMLDEGTSSHYFRIFRTAGGLASTGVAAGGTAANAASTATTTQDIWNHQAGVFVSATSRLTYVNGVADGSNTTNVTPAGVDNLRLSSNHNNTQEFTVVSQKSASGTSRCRLEKSRNWRGACPRI